MCIRDRPVCAARARINRFAASAVKTSATAASTVQTTAPMRMPLPDTTVMLHQSTIAAARDVYKRQG